MDDKYSNPLDLLHRTPSLVGIEDGLLQTLADHARWVEHPPGAVIEGQGATAKSMHLVVEGEVLVVSGEGRHRDLVRRDGPGALFGAGRLQGRPEAANFEAVGSVVTLVWDEQALESMLTGPVGDALAFELRPRLSLLSRRSDLLDLLASSAVFRGTGTQMLAWLLDVSTLVPFQRGDVVMKEGEDGESMALIVRGEVGAYIGEEMAPRRVMRRGDCFGEIALIEGSKRTATVTALTDTELLVIGADSFEALAHDDPSFRRAVRALAGENLASSNTEGELGTTLIVNETEYETVTIALLVAEYLARSFDDRVAVLDLRADAVAIERRQHPARVVSITAPALDGGEPRDIQALLHDEDIDFALLCVERGAEGRLVPGMLPQASTVIYLNRSVEKPFPYQNLTRKMVRHVAVGTFLTSGLGRQAGIRIDFGVRPGKLAPELVRSSEATRRAVGRLGRAIVQREVGIALGGGAAWGFAHLPLLWGLHDRGIPIDMVSGVSFGASVGACYASMGLRGLEKLLDYKWALAATPAFTGISMWPWGRLFEHMLEHRHLEQLPTPLLVQATDILSGRPKVFRRGLIHDAVRASCTLPGMAGPTVLEGRRYVDGCIIDNVPVQALREEGADFVVASNVVPAPQALPSDPHDTRLQRLWSVVSPFRRSRDAFRSFYLSAHHSGDRSRSADVQFSPDLANVPIPEYSQANRIIELATAQIEPVLDEIVDRYRSMGRTRPGDPEPMVSIGIERAPVGTKPPWKRRPEIRADGPPPLALRGYLGGLRVAQRYFRYETEGYEHILRSPSALIVAYHGRPVAWDQGLLTARIYDDLGYCPRSFISKGIQNIPVYRTVAESFGALYSWPEDAEIERILNAGHHIMVAPGGMREAMRPWWEGRYQINFGPRRGYLELALSSGLPIIPVVATGVDDVYIGLNDGYKLSKLLTGTSYYSAWFGLGIGGFCPFALPLPVHIRQRIGPPIDLRPLREDSASHEEFLARAHELVVGTMQGMLDDLRVPAGGARG